jgi:DNA-binding CsgD family transcriptional regulator
MGDGSRAFFDPWAIPLMGREQLLNVADEVVASDPGCLVVVGEPKVGNTRVAIEVMKRAGAMGWHLFWAETGAPDPLERLRAAVSGGATEGAPFAAYLGACRPEAQGRLARALAGTGGLAICEARSSVGAPSLKVDPLDEEMAAAVVEAVNPALSPEARDRVVTLSDGLPGCIVPLVLEGVDGGLPTDLGDLVRDRLGVLTEAESVVVAWAAALGWFDMAALVALTGQDDHECEAAVAGLRGRGVFRPDARSAGLYDFVHELTRWAVKDAHVVVDPQVRLTVDVRSDLLAQRRRLVRLGDEYGRPDLMLRHVDAALGEWRSTLDPRVELEFKVDRARALELDFRIAEALNVLRDAANGFQQIGEEDRTVQLRSIALALQSRLWDRESAFGELASGLEAPHEPGEITADGIQQRAAAGLAALMAMRPTDAIRLGEWVLAQDPQQLSVEVRLRAGLAVADGRASLAPTRGSIEGIDAIRREALEQNVLSVVHAATAAQLAMLGDIHANYEEVRAVAAATAEQLRGSGNLRPASFVDLVAGSVLLESGRLGFAQTSLAAYEPEDVAHDPMLWPIFARLLLDRANGDQGELHQSLGRLKGRLSDQQPELLVAVAFNVGLASCPGESLDMDAERLLTDALVVREDDVGALSWKLHLLVAAIEFDIAPGRAHWRNQMAALDVWGGEGVRAYCRYADCFSSDLPEASVAFREAADGFAERGMHWWAARAMYVAGRTGSGDQAVADLRRARESNDQMGAAGWRQRIEEELRNRGHRWRDAAGSHGVLSARELEVVRELAVGHSNAQIAGRLVLSENTVARHLTRIYKKLGVATRQQAMQLSEPLLDESRTEGKAGLRLPRAGLDARQG